MNFRCISNVDFDCPTSFPDVGSSLINTNFNGATNINNVKLLY